MGDCALNADFLAPGAIIRRTFQLLDQPQRDVVVFDGLTIGSDVAAGAVEIGLADVERIAAEFPGDLVDDALDRHHPLRAAETAERGIRHRVGLDATRIDAGVAEEIGVVGVEHGAIDHAQTDVRRAAAARVEIDIDAADAAVAVEADRVVDQKVVAFAGHRHVGVAIEPELARLPGRARRQRGNDRPLRCLRFLAAEAAAHAAYGAGHERIRQCKNAGDDMLHFARMLGRGIDQHRAILAGQRKRDLAFQIKMLLAADADASFAPQRRCGDRLGDVAVDEGVVRQHGLAGRFALLDRDVGLFRVDLDPHEQGSAPRGVARGGDDRKHRLAVEENFRMRKDRLVGAGW